MPSVNKKKSPLAFNPKPVQNKAKKPSSSTPTEKMEVQKVEESGWSTAPIMEGVTQANSSVAAQKAAFFNTNPTFKKPKQKSLSKKAKARKEKGILKAQGFLEQLEAKGLKSKGREARREKWKNLY